MRGPARALAPAGGPIQNEEQPPLSPFALAHARLNETFDSTRQLVEARGPDDYSLITVRRYRLVCRGPKEAAAFNGATLRVTLVYDDDGAPVVMEGGPLLDFPKGTGRYGTPAAEIVLVVEPSGVTKKTFGLGASSYRHRGRHFRLVIERLGEDGEEWKETPGRIRVRTTAHASKEGESSARPRGTPPGRRPSADSKRRRRSVPQPSTPSDGEEPRIEASVSSDSPSLSPPHGTPPSDGAALLGSSSDGTPPAPDAEPEDKDDPLMTTLNALAGLRLADSAAALGPLAPPPPSAVPYPPRSLPTLPPYPLKHEKPYPLGDGCVYPGPPDPPPLFELGGGGEDELPWMASAVLGDSVAFLPSPAALPPGVFAFPLAMPRPFRHPDDASRAAAASRVAAARGALLHSTAAAGLKHPVSLETIRAMEASLSRYPLLKSVELACEDLATVSLPSPSRPLRRPRQALSSVEVFDTELFRTQDGRYNARMTIEDLRLCGSAHFVDMVLHAWGSVIRSALAADPPSKDDAVLLCEHAWHAMDVILGPISVTVPDLLPVGREFFFDLQEGVEKCLAGYTGQGPGGDNVLRARVLARRARILLHFEQSAAAVETYFDAWALLVGSANSPSRLEAAILRELADIHMRLPAKFELGSHLCSRLYWFCETPDDLFLETLCLQTCAQDAAIRRDWQKCKSLLRRAMSILSGMSIGYRYMYQRAAQLLMIACCHSFDVPSAIWVSNRVFSFSADVSGYSFPEHDVVYYTRVRIAAHIEAGVPLPNHVKPPNHHTFLVTHSVALTLLARLSPISLRMARIWLPHARFQLGIGYAAVGAWDKALSCFQQAQSLAFGRYPAYFPSSLLRARTLADMIGRCRAALAAGRSPGGGMSAPGGGAPPPQRTPQRIAL